MEYTEIIACRNRKCKYHLSNDNCPDLCSLAAIIMDEDGKCHAMEEKIYKAYKKGELVRSWTKFYYVESIDDYWIGEDLGDDCTLYYAKWDNKLGFVFSASRYLPWGEHVVSPTSLWKKYTYPSEPKEIPFTDWIMGFVKKYFKGE